MAGSKGARVCKINSMLLQQEKSAVITLISPKVCRYAQITALQLLKGCVMISLLHMQFVYLYDAVWGIFPSWDININMKAIIN